MPRIAYENKTTASPSPLPAEEKWTSSDANQVKDSVNAIYDADAAIAGEVVFNDGTNMGKSPDLIFDDSLQIGANSNVGEIQLGGSTDTAVGTVSSNGVLTLEGNEVKVASESSFSAIVNGQERLSIDSDGTMSISGSTGSSGQFLKTNGPSAPPEWGDITAGILVTDFLVMTSGGGVFPLRRVADINGREAWEYDSGTSLTQCNWTGDKWLVVDSASGDKLYESFDDVPTTIQAANWEVVNGIVPTPTFQLFSGSIQEVLEQIATKATPTTKVWRGTISQDGTDDPILLPFAPDPYGDLVATYTAAGSFLITSAGLTEKTTAFITANPSNGVFAAGAYSQNGGEVIIYLQDAAANVVGTSGSQLSLTIITDP